MAQVSVTTAATALLTGDESGGSPVVVKVPPGGSTVYVDTSSGVTTSNGFAVEGGSALAVKLTPGQVLYGIVGTGSQTVQVIEDGEGYAAPSATASTTQTVEHATYSTVASGELAGNTNATQMPTVSCKLVKFKASYDNAGRVYIGGSGVTVADGSTDTTTGFQLSAGEETGWLPVANLNVFYRKCDNAGDDLTYLALV